MLNRSGCTAASTARDNFLTPQGLLQSGEAEASCNLIVPLYFTLQSLFALVSILVAIARTLTWRKRQLALTKNGRTKRYRAKKSSFSAFVSAYVLLIFSWMSAAAVVLMIILPLVLSELNNSMIFLLGAEFFLFNIICERWLSKLIRLGVKILPKNVLSSRQMIFSSNSGLPNDSGDSETTKAVDDRLAHMDALLVIVHALFFVSTAAQLILMCVLSLVFRDEYIYLQLGVGLEGLIAGLLAFMLLWQYQRCIWAIRETDKNVQGISPVEGQMRGIRNVENSFRQHQLVIFLVGFLAFILNVLWAFRVFELGYGLILVSAMLDTFGNGASVITFVLKSFFVNRKPANDTPRAAGSVTILALNQKPIELKQSSKDAESTREDS